MTRLVKEAIQIIDTKEEEKVYVKSKYPDYYEMIDYEAQNYFISESIIIAILKYAYGFNQHATRDTIINQGLSVNKCPRCSQKET